MPRHAETPSPSESCSPEILTDMRRACVGLPLRGWHSGPRLGRGRVRKAVDAATGRFFAIKSFRLKQEDAEECARVDGLESEIARWTDLSHPCLVRVLGCMRTTNHLHVQMSFVAGGSLWSFLEEFGPLGCQLTRTIFRGVLEGLQFLHTRDRPIAHRNLKGSNVLLEPNMQVKLTDFGSGCPAGSDAVRWAAPEVARGEAVDACKSDMWSAGCVVLEMATAEPPWGKEATMEHVAQSLSADTPPAFAVLSGPWMEIASRCFQPDPDLRALAAQLLHHELMMDAQ